MELSEKDIILLENWREGALSATEEAELENRLRDDQDFRQAVAYWEKLFNQGFKTGGNEREQRRAQLQALEAELPPVSPARIRFSRWWGWLVLLLALLAILLKVGWPFNQEEPTGPIASIPEQFFTPLENDLAVAGPEDSPGQAAYNRESYAEALPLLIEEARKDSLLLLFAGVAAIATNEDDQAVSSLNAIFGNESFIDYQSDIGWYLALAYLETGQIQAATLILQALVEDSYYGPQARELLDILEKK